MNSIKNRIIEVRGMLRLSVGDMTQALGLSEEEYNVLEEEGSSSIVEFLVSEFNVRLDYLLSGKGPVFRERSLPIEAIIAFRDERNWQKFHNPKDVAISITLEASELLECFQWSGSDVENVSKHHEMEEELADILIYCVQFADAIGADIPTIIREKMVRNGVKYPH